MSAVADEPSPSLVVECPGCRNAIAVRGDLTYRAARCPLCAAEFLIPKPRRTGLIDPPAPQGGAPAPQLTMPADPGAAPRSNPGAELPCEQPLEAAQPPLFSLPELLQESPPSPRSSGEWELHEPEKTIETPGGTLRLRRLSPEERQARRTRRNVIMLCGGATILFLIVFLFRGKTTTRR